VTGARKRSHTRRYQSRCGQRGDSRTTIRRVRTTTSAATLMSRIRQVQGCPSLSGSRCRRNRKGRGRCRAAPVRASAGTPAPAVGEEPSPAWLVADTALSAGGIWTGNRSAMNRRSRRSNGRRGSRPMSPESGPDDGAMTSGVPKKSGLGTRPVVHSALATSLVERTCHVPRRDAAAKMPQPAPGVGEVGLRRPSPCRGGR
jgi:hypothetical protein